MTQRVSRIFFLLIFTPWLSFGQNVAVVDTAAVEREVDSLIIAIRDLQTGGKVDEAYSLSCKTVGFVKKTLGEKHIKYATSMQRLGKAYLDKSIYDSAEVCYIRALEVYALTVGRISKNYAMAQFGLANVYMDMSEFKKAESNLLDAKNILELLGEKDTKNYLIIISNTGFLYIEWGRFEEAERLFQESIELQVKNWGKDDFTYIRYLNGLAVSYFEQSKYKAANKLWIECESYIYSKIGEKNTYYTGILNNLGNLNRELGLYSKAEYYYLKAKKLIFSFTEHPNAEHGLYANNLGVFYNEIGQQQKAIAFFNEAKVIWEHSIGTKTPKYAACINNLGNAYFKLGDYEKSKYFHNQAKSIRLEILGHKNSSYAWSLNNLGIACEKLGEYKMAESLQSEALEIMAETMGTEHPDYASILINLSELYVKLGLNDKAKSLLKRADPIIVNTFGKNHTNHSNILYNFVDIYSKERSDSCIKLLIHANIIEKKYLIDYSKFLSESELLIAHDNIKYRMDFFSSVPLFFKANPLSGHIFDNSIFYKGFVLENRLHIDHLLMNCADSTKELHALWDSYNRQLIDQYSKPTYERDSALVNNLQVKSNSLEKELARYVAGFTESRRQIAWPEVRDRLSPAQAAIEFIHFRYYNPEPTDSTLYAALVLLPGDTAPHFIPLCEQRQLDAVIAGAQGDGGKIRIQDIYWPDTKSGSSLYSLIWAPLEPLLKGVKTVYFSPSGLLHRLSPGAIGRDKRTYLSDSIQFVQLGSTRQLVTGLNAGAQNIQTAVVFGGIHYEMDSTAIARANAGIPADSTEIRGSGMFKYADPAERTRGGDEKWDFLPETAAEADSILQILKGAGVETSKYDGYKATEESFKQIGKQQPSPRILHLATHGFFFPDPKDTSAARRSTLTDEPVFKISEHPMIRSGLMLAGSKYAWDTGQALEGMEDGILTAYEISQMNLSNTELVVLSACETGLGDIQGNEGVYGLQRAFKIAGVKNIVMSLWKVPEAATRELMTAFYKKWLDDKLSVRDALREAQQYVRAQPRYNSPYFWAGFVLVE